MSLFFTHVLILLYFLGIAPKIAFDRIFKGKKHPGLSQRLGFSLPDRQGKKVIWIHAVSVGEVKSVQPLFSRLRKNYPDLFFLITTTSATGQAEAKRSLKGADAFAYLPIDLPWIARKWAKKLQPEIFILVESDFWPNLLKAIKKQSGRTVLVSGKLSEKSARRYSLFPAFSKKLFSLIDLLCLQNEKYASRFEKFVPDRGRLQIAGNLKLDLEPQPIDRNYWEKKLNLPPIPVITLSCTHFPEEDLLLNALYRPDWFFFLAPRHPERFQEAAQLLTHKKIPFLRWTQLDRKETNANLILVDAMGQLPICYTFSRLAVIGGSYIDRIGGHNILEPCLYGTPPFFGPHMFGQAEFASRVIAAQAGKQTPIETLQSSVEHFLKNPHQEKNMRAAAQSLIEDSRGATDRTLQHIQTLIS